MFQNPSAAERCALLKSVQTIAVVGLSPKPARPSHSVSRAMREFGFTVIPVHPAVTQVLGVRAYRSLSEVPVQIDLVNVFRRAEFIDAIVDECLVLALKALWIQEGIVNEGAARRARDAGLTVVMDRCIYRDYQAYCI